MKYNKICRCWSPSSPGRHPVPKPARASFTIQKTDSATGAPLSGGHFTLTQNGQLVGTAVSAPDGSFTFSNLTPGSYEMKETAAPEGYATETGSFRVVVDEQGNVTVNGVPAEQFPFTNTRNTRPSDRPVIQSVQEGDPVITGTGVPGSLIDVTLPDGSHLQTTVGSGGSWSVSVPDGTMLQAGDTIYASQTDPGKEPSVNASFLVQPRN